jgi:hypothetical protein
MYLCVKYVLLFVKGATTARGRVDADLAGDPCPIPATRLQSVVSRLRALRDHVLHEFEFDRSEEGYALIIEWASDPMSVTMTSVAPSGPGAYMTLQEIESLVDSLEPWLRRHWERLTRS